MGYITKSCLQIFQNCATVKFSSKICPRSSKKIVNVKFSIIDFIHLHWIAIGSFWTLWRICDGDFFSNIVNGFQPFKKLEYPFPDFQSDDVNQKFWIIFWILILLPIIGNDLNSENTWVLWRSSFLFSWWSILKFLNFIKTRLNRTNATLRETWPWNMRSKTRKTIAKIGLKFCN